MFKALVMVELLDSEEEEETKGREMTRSSLKKREELGYFTNIARKLQLEDIEEFKEMMRMNFKHFNEILNAECLTVTLRFLATWETFQLLSFQFRISDRAIFYIVKEIRNVILKYLVPFYLKVQSTEEEWLSIAEKFETRWQYPNVIEVIDGKHVVTRKPLHGGSHYYNYKHLHSII